MSIKHTKCAVLFLIFGLAVSITGFIVPASAIGSTSLPKPDFRVSSSPSCLTIVAGSSQSTIIQVASVYRFNGTITLATVSPNGIKATLAAPSLQVKVGATTQTTTLSIGVGPSTSVGIYKVLVTGSNGTVTRALNVTVNVVKPDFAVNAFPAYVMLQIGATSNIAIKVASLFRFNGTVQLTVSAPAGISAALLSTSLAVKVEAPSATTNLTITVPTTATPGQYKLMMTGSSGSLAHVANVTLQVIKPDFYVTANPAFVAIPVGTSTSTTLKVASLSRYNGTVMLSASSPSGIVASLSTTTLPVKTETAAPTSSLALTVPSSTLAGRYLVTVTATDGTLTHTAVISVNVIKPDFAVVPFPSYLTMANGTSKTATIRATSLNRFNGTITLTATPQTGVAASLAPSTLQVKTETPSATSALTINVPTTTAPGTYKIQVLATSGSLTHDTTVTVRVVLAKR